MRTVVHWDGDSFFASIEQAADRRLRGRPLAIGGSSRGVVLSASREARRLGVRPGWPTQRARRAIPALVVLAPHFELYEQFSEQILGLCRETTPLVEPASVGAAWLDLTGTRQLHCADAASVVAHLRATARDWLRVSISAGISTNKIVARIAARVKKPGAQVVVPPGSEAAFLAPLPLGWLPGIDREALSALEIAGVRSIGQFATAPIDALSGVLGRDALTLQRRAQGVNEEPVGRKKESEPGFSESIEFQEDVWDEPFLLSTLRRLAERLMAQVRAAGVEARQITLRLRYTDREEARRSVTLAEPASLEACIFPVLPGLLETAWQRRVRLRMLSLRATRIYRPSPQLSLFDPPSPRKDHDVQLAATLDALRRRFGAAAILRGDALREKKPA
jgi:nucleotidyltransferase/DNA polymerase involved in DNA repair